MCRSWPNACITVRGDLVSHKAVHRPPLSILPRQQPQHEEEEEYISSDDDDDNDDDNASSPGSYHFNDYLLSLQSSQDAYTTRDMGYSDNDGEEE
jgi:hypothetical protein